MPVAVGCLQKVVQRSGHLKLSVVAQPKVQAAGKERDMVSLETGQGIDGAILIAKSHLCDERAGLNESRVFCHERTLLRLDVIAAGQINQKRQNGKEPSNWKSVYKH